MREQDAQATGRVAGGRRTEGRTQGRGLGCGARGVLEVPRQILGFNWTLVAKCKGQVCEAGSRGNRTRKLWEREVGPAHAHGLTVCAGAALPAVPADAGEGVPAAHTGAPVPAGVGQAAAALSCKGGGGEEGGGGLSPGLGRPGAPPHASTPDSEGQAGPACPRGASPTVQVLPFQPGGQAQRKVSPLS